MAADELVVHGAREHNLKDITVELPRNRLIVFTGLSGSGKSSLAFDTIYAEGQRRYVESLSRLRAPVPRRDGEAGRRLHRRPEPGHLDRPEDDARATRARPSAPSPRSTTTCACSTRASGGRTARTAASRSRPRRSSRSSTTSSACRRGTRFLVSRPVVRDHKGEYKDVFEDLRREGFSRVRSTASVVPRGPACPSSTRSSSTRSRSSSTGSDARRPAARLTQSIETRGRARARASSRSIVVERRAAARSPSTSPAPTTASRCRSCSRASSPSTARTARARAATASARSRSSTPTCSSPTRRSRSTRALVAVVGRRPWLYEPVIQAVAERFDIDPAKPWRELTEGQQGHFLKGTSGDRVTSGSEPHGPATQYMLRLGGHRRRASAPAHARPPPRSSGERIEEYMRFAAVPGLQGRRPQPEVLARHHRGPVDPRSSRSLSAARRRSRSSTSST